MPLETYLPKKEALTTKFSVSLTPSESSRPSHPSAAISYPHKDRKVDGIKFKEKRLDARIWRCKGVHQRGSHFPICVFTNNVGRRSPQKLEERRQRQMQRPRFVARWPQGSQERPPLRARPQQGSQADADPQQGWQPRAEERPAVAGEHEPDALARWRTGRRRDTQSYSHASSDTWSVTGGTSAPGWGEWTAAVAASGPMWVPTHGARLWSDEKEDDTPASALREVVQASHRTWSQYVQLCSGGK